MRMEGITKNSTLLCVPIMADSIDAMIINLKKAGEHGADIVEIRLDSLKVFNPHQDLKSLIKESPVPTIFTYRPKWEGGQYDGDENQRRDVLRLAMKLGADYIDVELQVAHEFIDSIRQDKPENFKVVVSSHNYENTPSLEDLGSLVAEIQASGADIVKIVSRALDITVVSRVFQMLVYSQVAHLTCELEYMHASKTFLGRNPFVTSPRKLYSNIAMRLIQLGRRLELLIMWFEDKLMENYVAITQIVMVLFWQLKMDYSTCIVMALQSTVGSPLAGGSLFSLVLVELASPLLMVRSRREPEL